MNLRIPNYFIETKIDFLDNLLNLPNNIGRIMSNAVAVLIILCFILGIILSIIGLIKWATGWDEKGGKKSIVKGVVLIILSLAGGSIGITIVSFT